MIAAGVTRVVIAATDPNPVAAGGADALRAAGIAVDIGLLRQEAVRQNTVFMHGVRARRPFVRLKGAVSLDGRVAAADGSSKWLTGDAARHHAHELRAQTDAMLVGSGTMLADDPQLTVRLAGHGGPQPLRVVLDGRGRTPAWARMFDDRSSSLVLTAPGTAATPLRDAGIAVAEVATGDDGRLDPRAVLAHLWQRGIRSVLVEGGPTVATSFLASRCVDSLVLYVAPLLLGDKGLPFAIDGPATLNDADRFALERVERVGDDAVLHLVMREE